MKNDAALTTLLVMVIVALVGAMIVYNLSGILMDILEIIGE